jgi:hypothetical protein
VENRTDREKESRTIHSQSVKHSLINCLKEVKFDVIIDEIKVVQYKLFEALMLFDDLSSRHSKRPSPIPEGIEINYRVSGVVQDMGERLLWEKVFFDRGKLLVSEKKELKSAQILKQAIVNSLRRIEFDIAISNFRAIGNKLALAAQFLRQWINLCPEKAELCTYEEWNKKRINELSLQALEETCKESGRIKGLVECLD